MINNKHKPIKRTFRDYLILSGLYVVVLIVHLVTFMIDLALSVGVYIFGLSVSWTVGLMFIIQPLEFITNYGEVSTVIDPILVVQLMGVLSLLIGLHCGFKIFTFSWFSDENLTKYIESANNDLSNIMSGNTRFTRRLGIETDYGNVISPNLAYEDDQDMSHLNSDLIDLDSWDLSEYHYQEIKNP